MGIGNYSEDDVKECARAFTGWTFKNPIPTAKPYGRFKWEFEFRSDLHDYGEKTFLGETGTFNGEDIVDIVVRQPATAQFLARRLYAFFVADRPDQAAIDELADVYFQSGYEIRSMLRSLFLSDSFRSRRAYYAMVKSPADYVVGLLRLAQDYSFPKPGIYDIAFECRYMGQDLLNPPSVEGWHTGKEWIDTGILVERVNFAASVVTDPSEAWGAQDRRPAALCRRPLPRRLPRRLPERARPAARPPLHAGRAAQPRREARDAAFRQATIPRYRTRHRAAPTDRGDARIPIHVAAVGAGFQVTSGSTHDPNPPADRQGAIDDRFRQEPGTLLPLHRLLRRGRAGLQQPVRRRPRPRRPACTSSTAPTEPTPRWAACGSPSAKLTPSTWTSGASTATVPASLSGPRRSSGPAWRLWIVDEHRSDVQCFETDGRYVSSVGGFGSEPGQLNRPAWPGSRRQPDRRRCAQQPDPEAQPGRSVPRHMGQPRQRPRPVQPALGCRRRPSRPRLRRGLAQRPRPGARPGRAAARGLRRRRPGRRPPQATVRRSRRRRRTGLRRGLGQQPGRDLRAGRGAGAILEGDADLSPWAVDYLASDAATAQLREQAAHPEQEKRFWGPTGIKLDDKGRLYVVESCRHRMQIYQKH